MGCSARGGRFGKYGERKKNERLRKAKIPGPEQLRYKIKQDKHHKKEHTSEKGGKR
ncbi:MAG: hypothetical protein ACUVWJ_02405 [Spirochaetota bacterium]